MTMPIRASNRVVDQANIRVAYLRQALRNAHARENGVAELCISQGKLAAASIPALGIRPVSLNTLKSQAERYVKGGWTELNNLRLQIRKRQEVRAERQTRPTRLSAKIDELDQLRRSYIVLTRAYFDLLSMVTPYMNSDEDIRTRVQRHRALFSISGNIESVK